jgi:GNAT superfamily N-acetyltransferase
MDGSTNLCQVSTGQEQDWKDLYNSAFPADERTPLEELQRLLDSGSILLHRTTNKAGELLCFSIVYPMSNFALLSYIASDATKRSTGIGSKHMKRLLEILKSKYPEFLGLVLEIESTRQQGLESADKTARQRRLAFYQRLGAKRLCRTYVWPSYSLKGTYRLAELMWFDFDPATIDDPQLPGIIKELYMKGYGAQEDDPILELVTHQFKCSEKTGSAAVICPVEPAEGDKKSTDKTEVVTSAPVTTEVAETAAPATTDSVVKTDDTVQSAPVPPATDDSPAPAQTVTPAVPAQKKDKKSTKSKKGSDDNSSPVTAPSPEGEKGGDKTKDGA